MDKKDIAIIKANRALIKFGEEKNVYEYYLSYAKIVRGIRKIIRKSNFCFICQMFYGNWRKYLESVKLVIMFDTGVENVDEIAEYIKRANPEIRLVFWYWNPVSSKNEVAIKCPNIDEVWTYNRFDAKKYNLRYSPQFYSPMRDMSGENPSFDLMFLGRDKGRRRLVEKIKEGAEAQSLKCNFIVIEREKDLIDYGKYLEFLDDSKCIVDLVSRQDCGLTLRPLEALFYKKKLITNYEDIVSYDFYKRENIFVIGRDNINELSEFINSPYAEIDSKIVNFYTYENWLKRIESGEDVKP